MTCATAAVQRDELADRAEQAGGGHERGDAEQQRDAGGDGGAEREQQDQQRAAHREHAPPWPRPRAPAAERVLLGGVAVLLDAQLGMRLLDGGDGGQRRVGDRFELLDVGVGLGLPGSEKVTSDRAAVLGDGVRAVLRVQRALDVGDALDRAEATDDVLDRGGDLRIIGLDRALALDEHALADGGRGSRPCRRSCRRAWTRRCPSRRTRACFWPTLPPIKVARTTKRIQPMMAVLRCVALHLPARAARLRGCTEGISFESGGEDLLAAESQPRQRSPTGAARRPAGAFAPGALGLAPPEPVCCPVSAATASCTRARTGAPGDPDAPVVVTAMRRPSLRRPARCARRSPGRRSSSTRTPAPAPSR